VSLSLFLSAVAVCTVAGPASAGMADPLGSPGLLMARDDARSSRP
jgi:hypothetical protein